jgi:hypothetical protein
MTVPIAARIRNALSLLGQKVRQEYFIKVWPMVFGELMWTSSTAKLAKTNPKVIHIGKYSAVTFGATFLVTKSIQQEAAPCPQ